MFNDKNVSVYKITVTTDANKRIIGMKNSDNSNTSKITRDVQGNLLKSEVFDNKNNLIQREEISEYDNKKNWRSGLIGWPLDLTLPYTYYITYGSYFIEPSGAWLNYKFYSIYDINGNDTGKLTLINDFTRNTQYNSNNYPTKTDIKDAVNPTVNDTRIYSYANCQ